MLTLDLTNAPQWCDLIPGVRVKLRPLTTALMVSARGDPAIADLPEEAATEEAALAMAKALARRAILEWEGIGDAEGNPIEPTPEVIDALLDIWPAFEAFQTLYVAKALLLDAEKTPQRPCRLVLRRGRRLLRGLPDHLSRVPRTAEPAADARRRAGLGPGAAAWWADARHPRRGDRLGHGGGAGAGCCPRYLLTRHGRTAARPRGGDGPPRQRADRGQPRLT